MPKIEMLTFYAPAKVNLVLEVMGKYDNNHNYHRIRSISQTINLCDVLSFQTGEEILLKCHEPELQQDNLVVKAAELLREVTGYDKGAQIELQKHIPWGVGLGGGSSDAAATLLALNELWESGLSNSELVNVASRLGSDVPLFLYGGTALVEGKGENITPLPSLSLTWFVILLPPLPKIPQKTAQMYGKINHSHFTEGQFVDTALPYLQQGKFDVSLAFNVFEDLVFSTFPRLEEYKRRFEEAGAPRVCLTGSGPCLFTLLSEEEKAKELCLRLRKQGLECYLARGN
ncbi:MAG: 4-(cytidine 5'-diphospho)-2-C-methyl-D-erythritol kinase [Chloroflexota bacterium]|nr:4-(cytidine 5'-diphospho)-2-C-methyl-D-erythritol kinase [Chloroflexota bacterium]